MCLDTSTSVPGIQIGDTPCEDSFLLGTSLQKEHHTVRRTHQALVHALIVQCPSWLAKHQVLSRRLL